MKWIGLILLALGTALAASYGAQNIAPVTALSNAKVRAGVLGAAEAKAKAKYCGFESEGLKEADGVTALKEADGCSPADAGTPVAALVERLTMAFATRKLVLVEDAALAEVRGAWLTAAEQALIYQAWSDAGYKGDPPVGTTGENPREEAVTRMASRDALLNVYCATLRENRDHDGLKVADGCKPRKYSARVTAMMGLWESLPQKTDVEMPYKRKALEAALIARLGTAEDLETKLAAYREAVRLDTRTTLLAAGRERLQTLRKAVAPDPKLEIARQKWLAALEASIEPSAVAETLPLPPEPSDRLDGWLSGSGLIFLLGLVLIVAGVVVARRANKTAALADPEAKGGEQPADFGELLARVQTDVVALATWMTETESPDANDQKRVMDSVEALVRDDIERLIDSRNRLVARYGVGAFAEIFGPFSRGERYLNRAWSTVVDKHWGEATASMHKSAAGLAEAQAALATVIENHAKIAA